MAVIRPEVATPPKTPLRSTISVLAPERAAATAAATPAKPPPATTTSTLRAIGIDRACSRYIESIVTLQRNDAGCRMQDASSRYQVAGYNWRALNSNNLLL